MVKSAQIIIEVQFTHLEIRLYNFNMPIETIFFDLDATLYPESNGLWPAIRKRIDQYMQEQMGFPVEQIPILREEYYRQYGTTLRGLQAHYGIDAKDYLNYVHDLPLDNYLSKDLTLRDMLLSMPQKRWVFTNSDLPHAERVILKLGIEDYPKRTFILACSADLAKKAVEVSKDMSLVMPCSFVVAAEDGKIVVTHSSIMKMGVELGFAPADDMQPVIEETGKRVHAVWDNI